MGFLRGRGRGRRGGRGGHRRGAVGPGAVGTVAAEPVGARGHRRQRHGRRRGFALERFANHLTDDFFRHAEELIELGDERRGRLELKKGVEPFPVAADRVGQTAAAPFVHEDHFPAFGGDHVFNFFNILVGFLRREIGGHNEHGFVQ